MENGEKYYIISMKHTNKQDRFICLWRADNCGYCVSKEMAGIYEDYKRGYHDVDSLPVKVKDLDKFFIPSKYDRETIKDCIPNCKQVWDMFNLKMTKHGLQTN